MTLVGVGHALADAVVFVDDDLPKMMGLHPGSFNQVPDYRMRAIVGNLRPQGLMAGGSSANTVKLAAKLGLETHFVGQCGHDDPGQLFESELLGAGVRVNLTRSDEPTGLCVTLLTPESGRTVATFRSASGNLVPGLLGDTLLQAADVVVVEGYLLDEPQFLDELLGRCLRSAKKVALDVADAGLVDQHSRDLQRHLASGAISYLFVSEPEAVDLTGLPAEEALQRLAQPGATVVLKRQEEGWLAQQGRTVVAIPPLLTPPVDATGMDDGFQAGFFWSLGQGGSVAEACRAGRMVAACVSEVPGTRIDPMRWKRLLSDLAPPSLAT